MSESSKEVSFIDPQQLRNLAAKGEKVVIVDVRSADEFSEGHVEGAINVPGDRLAEDFRDIPKDARIVTVCNLGGPRSCNAAEQLKEMGYDSATALRGGIKGWREGD